MSLELFANELLLEIFGYLPSVHVLQAFYRLNTRFDQLIHVHFQTSRFDFRAATIRDFYNVCPTYFPYIKDHLVSLGLSDDDETPNQIELFRSDGWTLDRFPHLRSLSFDHLRSNDNQTAYAQRTHDLRTAIDKRRQEYALAEVQRSLYQQKRADELGVKQENSLNEVLVEKNLERGNVLIEYQRELSILFADYLYSNGFSLRFLFVLQMRTRNTLQSLGISRRTILLKNLIQANLLRKELKGELSMLYQANVSGIQFDQLFIHHVSDCPDIQHADMRHASFRVMSFSHSPSFAFSNLDYSDWSFSKLDNFDFDLTITLNNVRFTGSQLESVSFEAIPMNKVSFRPWEVYQKHICFLFNHGWKYK
ncbi:unnamed protein product [Adineta ricciae]|uniref:F-box domain-containing protein n=1 Tax=Adineta ricciae TaxID=249248 RepID=A0A815N1B6_ADIRI|nr:unnamed protein product [Adineta ricciae]